MGQYPVVMLTPKSAKQNNYKIAYACLREAIEEEFDRHEEAVLEQLRNAWWGLGKFYHGKRKAVSHDRKADMRTSVCPSIPIYRQDVHGRTSLAPSQYSCAWESGRGRGG